MLLATLRVVVVPTLRLVRQVLILVTCLGSVEAVGVARRAFVVSVFIVVRVARICC